MNKEESSYAIYKYDFHKNPEPTITAKSDGTDGTNNLNIAQTCFASLFDKNSVDNLGKQNKKGEFTRLPNDVIAKQGDIYVWRVNNSQLKEWWTRNGKDRHGIDNYEMQELESNPYCHVLIDNRPGHCILAIEKSTAWGSKPDMLRDMLLDNFNRILADRYDLAMRIESRMKPTDIWQFVYDRIYEHGDYIRRVTFAFQNPKKINKSKTTEIKSARVKAIVRTAEISKAIKGFYTLEFDQNSHGNISPKNRDMAEMVRLCADNGYEICITFKDFKTYRINDYVKAFFPMTKKMIDDFSNGQHILDGRSILEQWFDIIEEQTQDYVNEDEIPKRRDRGRK